MKHWNCKILKYFLLLLFLEYYGSITLFNHAHIIDGVTIVHSHPFNSDKANDQHTKNLYVLINLLSNLLATVLFLTFSAETYKRVIREINFKKTERKLINQVLFYSYGLRAPPFKYTCI